MSGASPFGKLSCQSGSTVASSAHDEASCLVKLLTRSGEKPRTTIPGYRGFSLYRLNIGKVGGGDAVFPPVPLVPSKESENPGISRELGLSTFPSTSSRALMQPRFRRHSWPTLLSTSHTDFPRAEPEAPLTWRPKKLRSSVIVLRQGTRELREDVHEATR